MLKSAALPWTIVPLPEQAGNQMKPYGHSDERKSRGIRAGSAQALDRFRQPLFSYLISALDDPDKWVRYIAADMLGTLRDPQAVTPLNRLLADPDEDVRIATAGALDAISHTKPAFTTLQKNGCDTCLIRMIAQEAFSVQKAGELHKAGSGCVRADSPSDRCEQGMNRITTPEPDRIPDG